QSRNTMQTGRLLITAARADSGNASVASLASVYNDNVAFAGSETLAVAFSLGAATGAANAEQTFDIQVTCNSSNASTGHLQYEIALQSDRFDGSLGEGQHAWVEPL